MIQLRKDNAERRTWTPLIWDFVNKRAITVEDNPTPPPPQPGEIHEDIPLLIGTEYDNLGETDEEESEDEDPTTTTTQLEPTTELDHGTTAKILAFAKIFEPTIDEEMLRDMLDLGIKAEQQERVLGVEDAIQWANDFVFNEEETLAADRATILQHKGDWHDLLKHRREGKKADRLSEARIRDNINPDNPEYEKLQALVPGFEVVTDVDWRNNSQETPEEPSSKFMQVRNAVLKMLYFDFYHKEHGMFVTLEHAKALGINLSPANWTTKENKAKGRPIWDYSRVAKGHTSALNNPNLKEHFKKQYGPIQHPSIDSITIKLLIYWEGVKRKLGSEAKREKMTAWKSDLAGAFTLLWALPRAIHLTGLYLGAGLVWLSFVGNFGWAGMPFVFDIITRALRWELQYPGILKGIMDMFADDAFGFAYGEEAKEDCEYVTAYFDKVLGPGAAEPTKTEVAHIMDIIGYRFNLINWTLAVKPANLKRALTGFYAINVKESKLSLKDCQRLGSWASRYSKCCPYITPWVRCLWNEVRRRHASKRKLTLSAEGQSAVLIIRSFLLGLSLENSTFTRDLDSFDTSNEEGYEWLAEVDASLSGIGIVWSYVDRDGSEKTEKAVACGAYSTSVLGFAFDSSFQNVSEFIAGIIGIVGLMYTGADPKKIQLRGDSKSALSWARTWKFEGGRVNRAACLYILLTQMAGVTLSRPEHIPGKKNYWPDKLSRVWDKRKGIGNYWPLSIEKIAEEIPSGYKDNPDHTDFKIRVLEFDVEEILDLCKGEPLMEEIEVAMFFAKAKKWVRKVLHQQRIILKDPSKWWTTEELREKRLQWAMDDEDL